MKSQARHDPEDRLLELAYGELPEAEARALQEHLKDCPRCTESLRQMRSVRTAMAPLAEEPVPDAGLDSLLAYAKSSAQRSAQAAAPARLGWRRFVMPVAGRAAASLFGVVVLREHQELDLMQPAAEQRVEKGATAASSEQYGQSEPPLEQAPVAAPAPIARGAAQDKAADSVVMRQRSKSLPPSKRAPAQEEAKVKERLPTFADNGALAEGRGAAREESEMASAGAAPQAAEPSDTRADGYASATGAAMKKAEANQAQASRAAPAAAPPPAAPARNDARDAAALSREAQAARSTGNRGQEALLLREALAAGAMDRAPLLRRLCEAELASGRTAQAREACRAAQAESPGSADARAAQRLLEQLDAPSAPAQ